MLHPSVASPVNSFEFHSCETYYSGGVLIALTAADLTPNMKYSSIYGVGLTRVSLNPHFVPTLSGWASVAPDRLRHRCSSYIPRFTAARAFDHLTHSVYGFQRLKLSFDLSTRTASALLPLYAQ